MPIKVSPKIKAMRYETVRSGCRSSTPRCLRAEACSELRLEQRNVIWAVPASIDRSEQRRRDCAYFSASPAVCQMRSTTRARSGNALAVKPRQRGGSRRQLLVATAFRTLQVLCAGGLARDAPGVIRGFARESTQIHRDAAA